MSKVKKRLLIVLGVLMVVLMIVVGVATIYFEGIAKTVVLRTLDEMGFEAGLEDLNIGIFGGSVELLNFSLKPKGGENILSTKQVEANLDFFKAIGGNILVEGFRLDGADVNARIDENGTIDLVALAEDLSEKESEKAKPAKKSTGSFQINEIVFNDVSVTVKDERADTPIKKLTVKLGGLNANLSGGEVTLTNLDVKTPEKVPAVEIQSLKAKGSLNPLSGEAIEAKEIYLSGLKGQNQLQSNGQFVVQQWAMDVAKANGLLGEATEESAPEEKKEVKLPELVEVQNVDYVLLYPGPGGTEQSEAVKVTSLVLRDKDLQVAGLTWNNDLSPKPVAALESLDLKGAFLDTPPVLQDVDMSGLKVNLTKKPASEFDVLNRVNGLMDILAKASGEKKEESSEEKPSPSIKGQVSLSNIECHVVTDYGASTADDGVRIGDAVANFSNGNFSVKEFVLSDEKGNFETPSIKVDSVEGRSNLSYPLPDEFVIDQITVSSTDVNAAVESEGGMDLQRRMERLTDRGQEETGEPTQTAQKIDLKELKSSDMHILVRHGLGEGKSVPYEITHGELTVTDYVTPQSGNKTAAAKFDGELASPASGMISVNCRSPQSNFADSLALNLLFELSDITALSPYYAEKFPFFIESGRFAFTTDGTMEKKNLDFPYTLKIKSPTLKAKGKEGFDLFGSVTEVGAQTLVNGLKNSDGDLVYSGKVGGTMDKPALSSPWTSMADLFRKSMLSNVKNLASDMITSPIDTSARIIGGTAREVGEGVDKVKEEAGKVTEKLKSLNPFGN